MMHAGPLLVPLSMLLEDGLEAQIALFTHPADILRVGDRSMSQSSTNGLGENRRTRASFSEVVLILLPRPRLTVARNDRPWAPQSNSRGCIHVACTQLAPRVAATLVAPLVLRVVAVVAQFDSQNSLLSSPLINTSFVPRVMSALSGSSTLRSNCTA